MQILITSAYALLRDDRGEDLAEYGLLVTLIALLTMIAVGDLGLEITRFWDRIVVQLAEVL